MVYLVRLNLGDNPVNAQVIVNGSGVQLHLIKYSSNVLQVLARVLDRRPSDETMDFVAFLKQKLREEGAVLTRDPRYQSDLHSILQV
jgi:hypothetical protein